MKKIPYGIIDYKELITEGYEYVDKTMYLSKLEDIGKTLIYLRPGRFGKSLFTSMLSYYYDVNAKDEFDVLFKDTYVYKNLTPNKNNYYILKFDFSGISVDREVDEEDLKTSFKKCVKVGINSFLSRYGYSYEINEEDKPDDMLKEFLSFVEGLKLEKKLYLLIDEYDNFTNAILEGSAKNFIDVVGNNGFVKSFYANIKIFVGVNLIDRVFITGICPITLDSMTTGFNIATDISTDVEFNSMIGLTHEEVTKLLEGVEKEKREKLYNLMVKHYDGYLFSRTAQERVFNATLVMYFLKNMERFNTIPEDLYDKNIVVNYGKIDNLLKLQDNDFYKEIIDSTLKNGEVEGTLKTKFNLLEDFTRDDIISLLYYFGYLTIKRELVGNTIIYRIPNEVMRVTYSNYFLKMLRDIKIYIDNSKVTKSIIEIMEQGTIETISNYVGEILEQSSNRIFMNFNEKHLQLLYYSLLMNIKEFSIRTEYECIGGGYVDIFIEGNKEYTPYNIMIELKYIKENEKNKKKIIEEKRLEGIEQLKSYKLDKDNLKKYLVIFTGKKIELLEEIE